MLDVEAVLFDLYDTLIWSDWPRHSEFLAVHLGVAPGEIVSAYDHLRDERDGGEFADAGEVLAAVMEHCGLEPGPAWIRRLVDLEGDLLADSVELYADSLPVLRRLRSEGIRTGVVSNCSPATRPLVDGLGLEEEADVVVLSCEVRERKPAPGIYRWALQTLGVPAGLALFVDDRPEYLDGAAELGMGTAQIIREGSTSEPGTRHPRVASLFELTDRLLQSGRGRPGGFDLRGSGPGSSEQGP